MYECGFESFLNYGRSNIGIINALKHSHPQLVHFVTPHFVNLQKLIRGIVNF